MGAICDLFAYIDHFADLPRMGIATWITKEIEKGGLQERIELGEGLAPFGPQRVRRIQNFRNAFLFFQGREWHWNIKKLTVPNMDLCGANHPFQDFFMKNMSI